MKLDRTGEFFICEVPRGGGRCGGRIARVDTQDGRRVLARLPGWDRGPDRVWHEPPNDFARRQRGYPARPLPERLTGTHNSGASWVFPMIVAPLLFRCSDCQTVHEIRPAEFGLTLGEVSMVTEPRT